MASALKFKMTVREEIIGGIKNAMERGDSFEKAVQSFVNAGYNPGEVRAAADQMSRGAMPIVEGKEPEQQPKPTTTEPAQIKPKKFSFIKSFFPKTHFTTKKFLIILAIVILLIVIGAIVLLVAFPGIIKLLSEIIS